MPLYNAVHYDNQSPGSGAPITAIDETDVIRCRISLPSPFTVEHLPFLSRMHRFTYKKRHKLAKIFSGKPAKLVFRFLMNNGFGGTGRVSLETKRGARSFNFRARNTQFSALYIPNVQTIYELETSAVLDRLIGPRDVFFDIGANWGWYSVLIAARPNFSGTVHAFEPFPPSYEDLTSIVNQAGLQDLITCHAVAVAEKESEAVMVLPDGLHSGLAKLGGDDGDKVSCRPLDSLGLSPPNVMKIDVEGHELGVLVGAAKIINSARPFIVIESGWHPREPRLTFDPLNHLIENDYMLFYPGWQKNDPDWIISDSDPEISTTGNGTLVLAPFLPLHRPLMGPLLNVIAVPRERRDEFRQKFA